MVKVSVIIPVYNGDTYLRDAIESVKTQTFTDWEIIAVDDGSRTRASRFSGHMKGIFPVHFVLSVRQIRDIRRKEPGYRDFVR